MQTTRQSGPASPAIPAIGEGKRGVDGHIGYLLRQAHSAYRIQMEKALAESGATLPQFAVLTMLAAYPGASNAALARLALLTPQTMTVIVANLEKANLVARTPHPEHGRIQVIGITAEGKQVLKACKQVVAKVEARLLAGLAPDEEAVVRRWLVKVALEAGPGGAD
ncbi:MAG: MarR family winged helix-turn-helix transcriptional regulator [Gammaproteobacteria bacterium]